MGLKNGGFSLSELIGGWAAYLHPAPKIGSRSAFPRPDPAQNRPRHASGRRKKTPSPSTRWACRDQNRPDRPPGGTARNAIGAIEKSTFPKRARNPGFLRFLCPKTAKKKKLGFLKVFEKPAFFDRSDGISFGLPPGSVWAVLVSTNPSVDGLGVFPRRPEVCHGRFWSGSGLGKAGPQPILGDGCRYAAHPPDEL